MHYSYFWPEASYIFDFSFSKILNVPLSPLQTQREDVKESRFPGTVSPNDAQYFTFIKIEIETF
jgi:hypothetical protein